MKQMVKTNTCINNCVFLENLEQKLSVYYMIQNLLVMDKYIKCMRKQLGIFCGIIYTKTCTTMCQVINYVWRQ